MSGATERSSPSTFRTFAHALTDRAVEFLAERRPSEDPLCLVVGYILPHNPPICSASCATTTTTALSHHHHRRMITWKR